MIQGKKYRIKKLESGSRCPICDNSYNSSMAGLSGEVFATEVMGHYRKAHDSEGASYKDWYWCDGFVEEVQEIEVGQIYKFVGKDQNCGTARGYQDPYIKITHLRGDTRLVYDIYSQGAKVDDCWGCSMREYIEKGDWVLVDDVGADVTQPACEEKKAKTTYAVGDRVGLYPKTTSPDQQGTVIEIVDDRIRVVWDDGFGSEKPMYYPPVSVLYPLPPHEDLKLVRPIKEQTVVTNIKETTMSVVNFIKDQALKVANPYEHNLRKAGLHSDCGSLTSDGKDAIWTFIEELPEIKAQLEQLAKDIIAEKEKGQE